MLHRNEDNQVLALLPRAKCYRFWSDVNRVINFNWV